MSAAQLMTDLARLGIRIEAHGGQLRYSPRSAVTPDLSHRMKARKAELLAMLRPEGPDGEASDPFNDWIELACPDGRISLIHPDHAGNELEAIHPPDPCPKCGTLWLWETVLGNWRCQRCDPPETARATPWRGQTA